MKVQLYSTSKKFVAEKHQLLRIVPHVHSNSPGSEPFVIDGPFTESKEWCAPTGFVAGPLVEPGPGVAQRDSPVERRSLGLAAAMPRSKARELSTQSSTRQSSFGEEACVGVDEVERMHEFLRSIVIERCDGDR